MNKRKRKKMLKSNREELRQNLLKLEEVTAYLQKQGVFSLDKFQENDWHLLILDDDLKKFSKKFEIPKNYIDWDSSGEMRHGIMMNGFYFFNYEGGK